MLTETSTIANITVATFGTVAQTNYFTLNQPSLCSRAGNIGYNDWFAGTLITKKMAYVWQSSGNLNQAQAPD